MPHQCHKERHRWFSDPLQFALTQNKIKKKKVQRNICFQATKQASTWAQQILNINEKLNYKHNLKWIFLFLANQNYSLQVNLTTLSPISFWVITPFSKREIFPKNFSFKLFPTKVFFFTQSKRATPRQTKAPMSRLKKHGFKAHLLFLRGC